MLEFARTAGVSRMLYISSAAVYGRNREVTKPIAETDPNGPLLTDTWIDYDESKRMAEALCAIYHREYGLGVSVARGFAFVGPHLPLDEHYAIGNFIRDALAGETIRIKNQPFKVVGVLIYTGGQGMGGDQQVVRPDRAARRLKLRADPAVGGIRRRGDGHEGPRRHACRRA